VHSSYTHSKLVRQLADMSLLDNGNLPQTADLRIGKLLDLSDSVRIAAAQLPDNEPFEPSSVTPESVRADFLRVRASLLKAVELSFNPGQRYTRIKLPVVEGRALAEDPAVLGAYQRFYASHQRDIVYRVQGLRERVSSCVSGASPELKQLARLDATLGSSLSAHASACFAKIPSLLSQRFEALNQPQISMSGEATHTQFQREIKNLLLAEIDARLLPIQGLVEALDDHISTY
jgi:hypothetical protein